MYFLTNNLHENLQFIVDPSTIDSSFLFPLSHNNVNSGFHPRAVSPGIRVSRGTLMIDLDGQGIVTLEISDVRGEIVKQIKVTASAPVPLDLLPGIYLAGIKSDIKTPWLRFLINPEF